MKAVIFDMDGVLINSLDEHYHSYKLFFKKYNINYTFAEFRKHDLTSGVMNVIPKVMKEHNKPFKKEMINEKFKTLNLNNIKLNPGVLPLLKALRKNNYRIAVASGGAKRFLQVILKKRKIYNYFDIIVTGEDNVRKKPNPDIFLKAAKKLKIKPKDCLVIEDSADGVKAAKASRMKVIGHKNRKYKQNLTKANKIVNSMDKITIKMISNLLEKG